MRTVGLGILVLALVALSVWLIDPGGSGGTTETVDSLGAVESDRGTTREKAPDLGAISREVEPPARRDAAEELTVPVARPVVRARLVDESGKGIAQLAFQLRHFDPRAAALGFDVPVPKAVREASLRAAGRTDPEGNVAITALPHEEPLELVVEHDEWLSPRHRFTFAGEPVDLGDIVLQPACAFTGTVLGPTGPVAGAFVTTLPTQQGLGSQLAFMIGQDNEEPGPNETATDELGRFRLGQQPPDTDLEIAVRAPGAPPLRQVVATQGAGTATEVLLRFPTEPEIHGHVFDGGQPVPGVRVRARRVGDRNPLDVVMLARPALTNEEGAFRLWAMPEGRYELTAQVGDRVARADEIQRGRQDVALRLPRLAGFEALVRERGSGAALPGIEVTCVPDYRTGGQGPTRRATSGEDGVVRFEGVQPGPHELEVSAREHLLLDPVTVRVLPAETPRVLLELVRGARLEVQVRDAAERPVPDAFVRARGTADRAWELVQPTRGGRTGADGRITLTGLGEGPYEVEAKHAARAPARSDVELSAGSTASLTIVLTPGGVIRGQVVGSSGRPLPGRSVVLSMPGKANVSCKADGQGEFRFERLEPGSYRVLTGPEPADRWGGHWQTASDLEVPVELGLCEEREIVLQAPPAAELIIVCDASIPVAERADCRLSLLPVGTARGLLAAMAMRSNKPLDEDGSTEIRGLKPGSYSGFFFAKGASLPVTRDLELVADQTTTWEVSLPRASLRGVIVEEDGSTPCAGARVYVRLADEEMEVLPGIGGFGLQEILSGQDGGFAIERLPPGRLFVEARGTQDVIARSAAFELRDGETRDGVRLVCNRIEVRGRVETAGGQPGPGMAVVATRKEDGASSRALTDASGWFALVLGPGTWTLESRRGAQAAKTEVTLDGAAVPTEIVLILR